MRKHVRRGIPRAPLLHDCDDLRDHVASALHDDGVADTDVLARDLVLIVQRRIGDDDTAHGDGLELCDRRQRAGSADLDLDGLEHRRCLLSRELVRDRPTWAARHEAEPLLQVEPVDLVDDAVDVVAEPRPLVLDPAVVGDEVVRPTAQRHPRVHRQAPAPVGGAHPQLRIGRQARRLAPCVGEEA